MLRRFVCAALFLTLAANWCDAAGSDRLGRMAGGRRQSGGRLQQYGQRMLDQRKLDNQPRLRGLGLQNRQAGSQNASTPRLAPMMQSFPPQRLAPLPAPRPVEQVRAKPPSPVTPAPVAPAAVAAPVAAAPVVPATGSPATAAPAPQVFETPAGATITLNADGLGEQPGQVRLHIGTMVVRCDVLGWELAKATFRLPEFVVVQPIAARLEVLLASGGPVASYAVKVIAPPKVDVHDGNGAATAAVPAPLVINKYAAQTSGQGIPVPATTLPVAGASAPLPGVN